MYCLPPPPPSLSACKHPPLCCSPLLFSADPPFFSADPLFFPLLIPPFPVHLLPPQWVLELDSSTPTKFSRHLIVRVPGWAFASNADVGAFVRSITTSPAGLESLYVFKHPPPPQPPAAGAGSAEAAGAGSAAAAAAAGEGQDGLDVPEDHQQQQWQQQWERQRQRVCFVDGAVYSRNRHFRLFGSTKGGKGARLEPTLRYCMSAACRNALPVAQHKVFLLGLICNVAPGTQLLKVEGAQQQLQQQQGGAGGGGSGGGGSGGGGSGGGGNGGGGEEEEVVEWTDQDATGVGVHLGGWGAVSAAWTCCVC